MRVRATYETTTPGAGEDGPKVACGWLAPGGWEFPLTGDRETDNANAEAATTVYDEEDVSVGEAPCACAADRIAACDHDVAWEVARFLKSEGCTEPSDHPPTLRSWWSSTSDPDPCSGEVRIVSYHITASDERRRALLQYMGAKNDHT